MPTMDQVKWAACNVTTGGETQPYPRGALLPEPETAEELSERSLLRLIGAVSVVEVVYTPEELAAQAQARGEASAAREAALDVDPSRPLAEQTPGSTQPGRPTLHEPSGNPVVIGDEDLKAEHEQAARARRGRGGKFARAEDAGPQGEVASAIHQPPEPPPAEGQ